MRTALPHKLAATTAITCALVLCFCLAGCQLVGALLGKATGSPPVEALYEPKLVPTLILAEHGPGAGVDDVTSEDIGRRVADFWTDQKKLPQLIDLTKLEELRLEKPNAYPKMSTVAIGRAVGAKQVLYVDVRDSHEENAGGSDTIRAKASVLVRMVDVETGNTLWPSDAADGYALDAETQYQARGEGVNESAQLEQVRAMIADKVVKLFYKHQPDDY